jgi:hypothetical protein
MLSRPVVATNFPFWYMKYRIKKNRRGYYLTNGKTRVGNFLSLEIARMFLSYVRRVYEANPHLDCPPIVIVK